MKRSELRSHREVMAEHMRDPDFRTEWERTRLAHEVAMRVLSYRVEHKLSQRALAEKLGVKQPAVARLEAGDVTPSVDTLLRLSRALGMEFHMDITPRGLSLSA